MSNKNVMRPKKHYKNRNIIQDTIYFLWCPHNEVEYDAALYEYNTWIPYINKFMLLGYKIIINFHTTTFAARDAMVSNKTAAVFISAHSLEREEHYRNFSIYSVGWLMSSINGIMKDCEYEDDLTINEIFGYRSKLMQWMISLSCSTKIMCERKNLNGLKINPFNLIDHPIADHQYLWDHNVHVDHLKRLMKTKKFKKLIALPKLERRKKHNIKYLNEPQWKTIVCGKRKYRKITETSVVVGRKRHQTIEMSNSAKKEFKRLYNENHKMYNLFEYSTCTNSELNNSLWERPYGNIHMGIQ